MLSFQKFEKDLKIVVVSVLIMPSHIAAKYNIYRRRAREFTSNAYLLLKDDIEEGDLNRREMTAKLLCTLENAMYKAMQ